MSFSQLVLLFQNAKCVIASTEAALVNTIFMKIGSKLESIYGNFNNYSQYRSLAINRGVNYFEPDNIMELLDSIENLIKS